MPVVRASVVRLIADGFRVAALAGTIAVAVSSGEGAVLLGLMFLALLVPRATRLPAFLDLVFCAALTWATWSSVGHWYRAADWYDTVVHTVTPGATAATLHLLLSRWRLLPTPGDPALRRAAVPLITTGLGAAVAVVWEMYEWLAVDVLHSGIPVGYEDTVADLTAGLGGSLTAGLLLLRWALRHPPDTLARRRTR
ncbi:hypothetical protein ACIBAG_27820 [Streptomyces sp. NPDC051243]|uniref:hypothetical protein n=1 Tax=Streptomyces sp. NPDC051243 TaxID=3365646 RepID=UPI0037B0D718